MSLALADTSFLFALYGQDVHTAAARVRAAGFRSPLSLTILQRYELGNAVRFAAFRGAVQMKDAASILTAFESDLKAGFLIMAHCDLDEMLAEAQRLSASHTPEGGHRSFDILHVASARVLKAGEFLTFDANQRRLAKAAGLATGPGTR
jgi:predicted nucleic acid-binding protein